METEYLYPALADRSPVALWTEQGCPTMAQRARARAAELLATHHVDGISAQADRAIRARFPIRLARGAMRPR
jgi:trimethylamine--corrinoid protein Co-methyltransferase